MFESSSVFRAGLLCVLGAFATCLAQTAASPAPASALATVDGQPIYEQDLLPLWQAKLRQLRRQEYDAKLRVLEDFINQRLVQAEAKNKGVTLEKLLQDEVDSKVAEPTDGELEAFYLGQKDRINVPLEQVKPQLRQALRKVRTQTARDAYSRRLREESQVSILLRPPTTQVSVDPARLRGNPAAPITIVEFSDFQCPFCVRAQATLKEVMAKYEGKVRLAYRDFPLEQIHAQAHKAAEAARCAGEQGKFWEYHDALYADNSKLGEADLLKQAQNLGLDAGQFRACLTSGKYSAAVDADAQDGANAGVDGTPAFLINGIMLSGAQPFSAFQNIIDRELSSASAGQAPK